MGNRKDMTVTDGGGMMVHVHAYSLIKIKRSDSLPERTLGRALNNRWPSLLSMRQVRKSASLAGEGRMENVG